MLKKYYTEQNNINLDKIIKDDCGEKKCVLSGHFKNYIILDGDNIKN